MNKASNRGRANDGSQKVKNKKATIKRLGGYLAQFKYSLIIGLVLMIVANILSLIGPYLIGMMINEMGEAPLGEINFEFIFMCGAILIIFYIMSAVLRYFISLQMAKIAQKVVYRIRGDLFNKMTTIKVEYFDTNQTGDIISRLSYDADAIAVSLAADVLGLITSVVTLVVSFVMMLLVSPLLVLAFIVTIPISFIVTRMLSKVIKKRLRVRNAQLGKMNSYIEEMISAQKTIQSYVQEDAIFDKFEIENQDAAQKSYYAGYYTTIVGPSVSFINNLGTVIVGTIGTILKVFNHITIGDLATFILYSKRFSGPINQISNLVADIQSALAAAERIFEVLDQKDEKSDLSEALTTGINQGLIEFKNLSFGYQPNQLVLRNVNFQVNPGSVVAIVGETGAGKTTLVNLLMRFYEPRQGMITLDGHEIDHYQRKYYRKAFSMVLQDTWLFYGTVIDNIKYGNDDVSDEDVYSAAKKAKIHHFISKLPQGYQTILSDDGINISKGQKQLIVIARAMLSNSQILILDEATSNVDTYTEVNIQNAMKTLMENKTSFIIAHRLSTIKNADLILLMKQGNIKEIGNHQTLMNKKGEYYNLFMSQFE